MMWLSMKIGMKKIFRDFTRRASRFVFSLFHSALPIFVSGRRTCIGSGTCWTVLKQPKQTSYTFKMLSISSECMKTVRSGVFMGLQWPSNFLAASNSLADVMNSGHRLSSIGRSIMIVKSAKVSLNNILMNSLCWLLCLSSCRQNSTHGYSVS